MTAHGYRKLTAVSTEPCESEFEAWEVSMPVTPASTLQYTSGKQSFFVLCPLVTMLSLLLSLCVLVSAVIVQASSGSQSIFPPAGNLYEKHVAENGRTDLFSPLEELGFLSTDTFTTLTHPVFPNYSVRVKKSIEWCDGTANAYTGYIDIEARHLFFYFFESRRNPDVDDVVFWTNGGPGCSSGMGLFMELGPCRVKDANTTIFNPHSWNEYANVFFIDQPVGVGFSYANFGETVGTATEAAKDIAAFVAIFFEHFTKFKGNPFHMSGESYGGRYIPIFSAEIYEQNARLEKAGVTPINLTSMMIGNGCTDFVSMAPTWHKMQCHVKPVMDISTCVAMRQLLPRCEKRLRESCQERQDSVDCLAAWEFCFGNLVNPYVAKEWNTYDITKQCEAKPFCYPLMDTIVEYLSNSRVRETLGVDPGVGNYTVCNDEMFAEFERNIDFFKPFAQDYISALLERGVRTLIYVGANDFICNWVGNERMTLALEWTGQEAFSAEPLKDWKVNGTAAGKTRSAGPLTFATIYGAGHLVPYDEPEVSLELVRKWLAEEDLL
ncbi:serine carboxypeptidase [Panus rudis PR-1116 ss-1]|nr:serine carboxypeptidase [Panus rudis PR-1116 ss-1]